MRMAKPYKQLKHLAVKYGPVSGFYLGPRTLFISVCGSKAVREALLNEDINGRPSNRFTLNRTFGESFSLKTPIVTKATSCSENKDNCP